MFCFNYRLASHHAALLAYQLTVSLSPCSKGSPAGSPARAAWCRRASSGGRGPCGPRRARPCPSPRRRPPAAGSVSSLLVSSVPPADVVDLARRALLGAPGRCPRSGRRRAASRGRSRRRRRAGPARRRSRLVTNSGMTFSGILVGPVVVGAAGDRHVEAVGAVVRAGDQVAARLGRGVGRVAAAAARSLGQEPVVDGAVDLVGGDVHDRRDPGVQARLRAGSGCRARWCARTRRRPSIERSTCDSAAKFTTWSCPGTSSPSSSASQMSPWTNVNRGSRTWSRLAGLPA